LRLATFRSGDRTVVGIFALDSWIDTGYPTMLDLIRDGEAGLAAAARAARTGDPVPVDRFLAPLIPGRIFGTGINYRTHVIENPKFVDPGVPIVNFIKGPNTVIGPGDPIVLPRGNVMTHIDGFGVTYEVELLAIVGRRTKQVSRGDAAQHIFGYTLINDVTSINLMLTNNQMMLGKNIDTFSPIGPLIITRDEFETSKAHISCVLNGKKVQDEKVSEMIHTPEVLLEWISSIITVDPGDCLSTGTPRGTALWHPDHPYLAPGDSVTVREDSIGELTNPVVAYDGRS
jgi:2-keto-4-pentenoate hydratase/2-oxohepta-3-ene-1,7-dioic acid hydratase in catechol pathway